MDVIVHYWPAVWCNPLGMTRRRAARGADPGSATRRCSSTTRSSPPGPTPARWCTPGCAKAKPEALGVHRCLIPPTPADTTSASPMRSPTRRRRRVPPPERRRTSVDHALTIGAFGQHADTPRTLHPRPPALGPSHSYRPVLGADSCSGPASVVAVDAPTRSTAPVLLGLAEAEPGDPARPRRQAVVAPVSLVRDTRTKWRAAMLDPRHRFLIDFCVP
jgi:hypothetical protein